MTWGGDKSKTQNLSKRRERESVEGGGQIPLGGAAGVKCKPPRRRGDRRGEATIDPQGRKKNVDKLESTKTKEGPYY